MARLYATASTFGPSLLPRLAPEEESTFLAGVPALATTNTVERARAGGPTCHRESRRTCTRIPTHPSERSIDRCCCYELHAGTLLARSSASVMLMHARARIARRGFCHCLSVCSVHLHLALDHLPPRPRTYG